MSKVYDLYCPNCGAYITFQTNECIYCGNKVFTEAPKKDLALKYLKIGQYQKAQKDFQELQAIKDNDSELFFYEGICYMDGKNPYQVSFSNVKKAICCIEKAIEIEPKAIYYYALAIIKFDFYGRKYLNTSPNYVEEYNSAVKLGLTCENKKDVEKLMKIKGIQLTF